MQSGRRVSVGLASGKFFSDRSCASFKLLQFIIFADMILYTFYNYTSVIEVTGDIDMSRSLQLVAIANIIVTTVI